MGICIVPFGGVGNGTTEPLWRVKKIIVENLCALNWRVQRPRMKKHPRDFLLTMRWTLVGLNISAIGDGFSHQHLNFSPCARFENLSQQYKTAGIVTKSIPDGRNIQTYQTSPYSEQKVPWMFFHSRPLDPSVKGAKKKRISKITKFCTNWTRKWSQNWFVRWQIHPNWVETTQNNVFSIHIHRRSLNSVEVERSIRTISHPNNYI